MNAPSSSLAERWAALRQEQPRLRIRDAASQLGVTEVELLQTRVGDGVQRLTDDVRSLLNGLSAVGHTMCLTRNDWCVHERRGSFEKVNVKGPVGLVVGPDIDLRLFLMHWQTAWSVTSDSPRGPLHSIQFFDKHGDAVLKVYHDKRGDREAWDALVADHTVEDTPLSLAPPPESAEETALDDVDVAGFLQQWDGLQDTHQFHGLLRTHKLSRRQALAVAEGRFTERLDRQAPTALLDAAAAADVPIMVFVGNRGNLQIHSGPVRSIRPMGDWINVLDPEFNLHLKTDFDGEVWRVRKPTSDGDVTSIELLTKDGDLVASFFGARKPGVPELQTWRALAQALA